MAGVVRSARRRPAAPAWVGIVRGDPASPRTASRAIGCAPTWTRCRWSSRKRLRLALRKRGVMHGCGHDGPPPCWSARRATSPRRALRGHAVLIFQPGEEGFRRRQAMIDDGPVRALPGRLGLRDAQLAGAAAGTIGVNPGPMMAASDRIDHRAGAVAAMARIRISRSTRCWWRRTSSPPRRAWCRATSARSTTPW